MDMDLGVAVSYEVLEPGTPVYSSDGEQIGTVAHVLAVESEDVFDGIVVDEHRGSDGHRFADADDVERIYERGVVLKLDRAGCEMLHAPSANPAAIRVNPAEGVPGHLHAKLQRAWDLLSGRY
jgi:uncharacterized protein YrrD